MLPCRMGWRPTQLCYCRLQSSRRRPSDAASVGPRDTALKVLDGVGVGFLARYLRLWVLGRKLRRTRRHRAPLSLLGASCFPWRWHPREKSQSIGDVRWWRHWHHSLPEGVTFGLYCGFDVSLDRCSCFPVLRCGSCNVKSEVLHEERGLATMTRGDPPWS